MSNEDLIKKIVHLMETDDSADAPADAVRWSKNLFRARAAEPKRSLVERVLGVLQLDLAPNKAVFGERSSSASETRQLLFAAGEYRIDLRVAGAGRGFKVSGQVLGAGFDGAEVKFFGAERSFTAKSNELSEFLFEKIAKGIYTLSLTTKEKEIVIENIDFS